MTVSEADENGRRELTIHSRPDIAGHSDRVEHTRHRHPHARGLSEPGPHPPIQPDDTSEIDVDVAYERLSASGYDYGPAFRGLRRITGSGHDLFAEISLDDTQIPNRGGFHLHPALADGALQAVVLAGLDAQIPDRPNVPFSFTGVRLLGGGTSSMRAQLRARGGKWSITAVDDLGAPVLSIESVEMRAIQPGDLRSAAQAASDALYEVRWTPAEVPAADVAAPRLAVLGATPLLADLTPDAEYYGDLDGLLDAVASGAQVPDRVVVSAGAPHTDGDLPAAVQALTERALELLKAWLAAEQTAASKLVLVTQNALAATGSDRPNLLHAALPGLVRSAHTEHPGRVALLDIDGSDASRAAVPMGLMTDEPEVAIREGVLYAPRLKRAGAEVAPAQGREPAPWHLAIDSPGNVGEPLDHAQPQGQRAAAARDRSGSRSTPPD